MAVTLARVVLVVCLMTYSRPGSNAASSAIQHTVASKSWTACGWLFARVIMSPREMSMSSARLIATAIGGNASVTGPLGPSITVIRLALPVGSATTSSPGRITPLATVPA